MKKGLSKEIIVNPTQCGSLNGQNLFLMVKKKS